MPLLYHAPSLGGGDQPRPLGCSFFRLARVFGLVLREVTERPEAVTARHAVGHLTARKVPGGARTAGDTLVWNPPKQEAGFELIKPKPPAA